MEDYSIGEKCGIEGCNQLDYLNYNCKVCNINLCKTHYHNEYSCPNSNKNELNNKYLLNNNNNNLNDYILCNFCNNKLYIKIKPCITCEDCKLEFCWDHKIPSSHNCIANKKIGMKASFEKRKLNNYFKTKLDLLKNNKN